MHVLCYRLPVNRLERSSFFLLKDLSRHRNEFVHNLPIHSQQTQSLKNSCIPSFSATFIVSTDSSSSDAVKSIYSLSHEFRSKHSSLSLIMEPRPLKVQSFAVQMQCGRVPLSLSQFVRRHSGRKVRGTSRRVLRLG